LAIAALSCALLGACLGFLPYNVSTPARIFPGDGGTMFLGFILATAIMAVPRALDGWPGLVPSVLLIGIPAFNAALVTVARSLRGVSLLTGGQDSCTHWLRTKVESPRQVALVLTFAQAALAGIAVFLITVSGERTVNVIVAGISTIAAVALIALIESSRTPPAAIGRRASRSPGHAWVPDRPR
jgi:UDP-GlcNAc:undecaprenyl-phosphate GlcNAc-1-phosphate transferase